jgi:hypothetical protein
MAQVVIRNIDEELAGRRHSDSTKLIRKDRDR